MVNLWPRLLGSLEERIGNEKSHRFAYLLHEPTLDPLRFGETVMVNRGVAMKAVDNFDEAAKWLGWA